MTYFQSYVLTCLLVNSGYYISEPPFSEKLEIGVDFAEFEARSVSPNNFKP